MIIPSPGILFVAMAGTIVISEFGLLLFRRSKGGAVSKDRCTLAITWILNFLGFGLGFFFFTHLPGATFIWREQICLLGIALFLVGLVLRWYSIFYLGRFFTANVAIAADHHVIDSGPYRLIRHPSYAGAILMNLGVCLSVGNIATLASIMAFVLIACLWRIHVEEAALREALGDQYQTYMNHTKRLLPFVY